MRQAVELERALRADDLDAARAACRDPSAFPQVVDARTGGTVLQLALFWSSTATIGALLDAGADPNFEALDGFPALLLVVHHRRDDTERLGIVSALLASGADLDARGLNDWTALHAAATHGDTSMVRLLLDAGADPGVRTRIDDLATPADEANRAGHPELARMLREAEGG
jgi:ankyrin repeat protein